jgi:hypothetical protein
MKMRVRVRFLAALLMVTLFWVFATPHGSYASGPSPIIFMRCTPALIAILVRLRTIFPFGAAIAAHGYLVLFPNTYADILTAGAKLRWFIAGVTIDQGSPTPASTSTNQGSSVGVDSNGNSNSTPTLITGTQPAWSKLQLPTPCFSGAGDCLAHVNGK